MTGMGTARTSKVYTISLPPDLAQKAEALARRDSRTMSELFREAFRTYYAQQARRTLEEIGEYAAGRNPSGYTEADIPRLIAEARTESRAERSSPRRTRANK
jgi:metal-responsive CopG/Arc/MetJ family transcriptional regulator